MPTGLALVPVPIKRNRDYDRNGTKSYVYLMEKWGFEPTLEGKYFQGSMMQQQGKFGSQVGGKAYQVRVVKKRVGPNTDEAEKITADDIQIESLYYAEVWIGTPPQKCFLNLDTASADMWIWSTKLPEEILKIGASKHTVFDPEKSSTFEAVEGSTWDIRFGSHTYASGQTVGTDTVAIGQMNLFKQTVQLADYISPEFIRGSNATDGTLGLAWGKLSSIEPQPTAAPVETMTEKENTQIHPTQRLFTMKLGSWRHGGDEVDHDQGFFTFGFVDYDLVRDSNMVLHYAEVDNSKGLWQYNSGSYQVNGETRMRTGAGNTAIVDTGTPLVLIDDECCKAIYAAIPGSKHDPEAMGYVFPAEIEEEQLPSVGFEVEGKIFAVAKEDLGFSVTKEGWIYGAIQSRGNLPMDIMGDAFLKSVYAIFDLANKRFGVTSRPELKGELELAPGAEIKKQSYFHRLVHRINHGKAPEVDVADRPLA